MCDEENPHEKHFLNERDEKFVSPTQMKFHLNLTMLTPTLNNSNIRLAQNITLNLHRFEYLRDQNVMRHHIEFSRQSL